MKMCIQENCLFLLDMAGTSEACEVSSTKKWSEGETQNISSQNAHLYFHNLHFTLHVIQITVLTNFNTIFFPTISNEKIYSLLDISR